MKLISKCLFFREFSISELESANAIVFGVSLDPPFANKPFAEKHGINCEFLSDVHRTMISDYEMSCENFVIDEYTAANRGVVAINVEEKVGYVWRSEYLGLEPDYNEVIAYCNS